MAKTLRTILGGKLLTRPLTSERLKDLPSPEVRLTLSPPSPPPLRPALIFRIASVSGAARSHPDQREKAHSSPGPAGKERQLRQLLLQLRRRGGERRQERSQEGSGEGQRTVAAESAAASEIRGQFCRPWQVSSKLSPELSELVVYCRSVPFHGFENVSGNPPDEMSSFSESEALRLIKDSGTDGVATARVGS